MEHVKAIKKKLTDNKVKIEQEIKVKQTQFVKIKADLIIIDEILSKYDDTGKLLVNNAKNDASKDLIKKDAEIANLRTKLQKIEENSKKPAKTAKKTKKTAKPATSTLKPDEFMGIPIVKEIKA